MSKTPEQKARLAQKEKERRAADKLWLETLPCEERETIIQKRRAEDRTRRAKFRETLSAEEVARRKAEAAEYSAARYLKEKEAFLLLPIEEQEQIRIEQKQYRQQWWEKNGDEQSQKRRDKLAAMSPEELEAFRKEEREYHRQHYWDNREDMLEKNRLLRLERGHIWEANRKQKFLMLSDEDQQAIVQADRLYQQGYYQENREDILEKKKVYYVLNRESILTNKHFYYIDHLEERLAYNKAYYNLNALELNERSRKWYEDNWDRAQASRRAYKEKYPEKVKAQQKASKHNRRNAPGKLTGADIQDAVQESEGRCPYCLCELVYGHIHIDHMRPLSRGGWNIRENIVACCDDCNLTKNDKTVKEFVLGLRYGTDG